MATYYQGGASEIQAGDNNLQTLYLMNPNLITTTTTTPDYSDQTHQHQQQQQYITLNPTVTPNTLTHGIIPQHHHPQLVGIPLAGPHHHSASGADLSRADLSRTSLHHHNHHLNQMASAINGLVGPRAHYASTGLWSPASDAGPAQSGPIQDFPGQGQGQGQGHGQARGGLSLSLSPGLQRARAEGDDGRMSVTLAGPGPGPMVGSKYLKAAQELLEEVVNVADNNNVGGGDHNNNNNNNMESISKGKSVVEEGGGDDDIAGGGDGGESSKKGGELSMAQRHELQMKKAKLLNMLDEVDQRYRQYNTQMQIIASSFEQAAGIGSAKSYTSLALKTISKQFRTLKDAISSQIKAANKSLGEENIVGVKLEGGGGGVGSRLRLVDQQISQHRALQQLGMMQHSHNAWRPQRGLPERAVSVLRAWLFEHFLHPYPKDSDKHMLAKQTGLTRSQVSNWFINARVRLWKPMVEEMYVEEMKSHEQNNIVSTDDTTTTTTTNNGGEIGGSSSKNERNQDLSTTNKTTIITQQQHQQPQQQGDLGFDNNQQTTNDMISCLSTMSTTSPQGFTLIGSSSDMETLMARSQKKHRSNNNNNNSDMNSPSSILSMDMEMKPIDHHQQQQPPKYGQYSASMTGIHGGTGYNNPYIMNNNHNNIGRLFSQNQLTTASYHGNAVALTLGLPHCDNSNNNNNNNNNNNGNNISLSESHHQQNFFPSNQGMDLGRRVEIGANEGDFCGSNIGGGGGHETSHPSNTVVYESIDIQSRKRFAAQILHDFVA